MLDADVSLISGMKPVHIVSSNMQLVARSDCLKAVDLDLHLAKVQGTRTSSTHRKETKTTTPLY